MKTSAKRSNCNVKMVKLLTYYTVYSLVACMVSSQDQGICDQLSECSCRMKDGSMVDITSLGKTDGTPLFQDVESSDGYLYSYNPCGGFTEGSCSNAAACKKDRISGESLTIGRPVGAAFSFDPTTNEVVILYTAGEMNEYHTITYLLCPGSSNTGPPQFYPNGTYDANLFVTTLYTVCACPGSCDANGVIKNSSSGLGGGSIFLICIALIFVLYFVIGSVFMKFVKKASGTDIIPNKSFWVKLPNNIKNGSLFIVHKCTCKKETYSSI